MPVLLLILSLQQATLRSTADTLEAANVVNGQPHRVGTLVRSVDRAGETFYIITTFTSVRGATSYDTLAVDARTLAPRWQRVHFATDSAAVRFEGRRVIGYSQRAGQPLRQIDRQLHAAAQPTALVWHLMQLRKWNAAYTAHEYDLWQDTVKRIVYRPVRRRMITHRGKQVDSWVVQDNTGATIWIDALRGHLIMRRDRTPPGGARNDGYLLVRR